jgi:branched-chain amino acid transport system substrate-binding protein
VQVNPVLREPGWDPPRVMGTAFENAWINPVMWQAIVGWIGLDQYDEGNPVGQQFLDRFEAETGRRPADATGCPGGARAGEDAAGGVGRFGTT